MAGINISRPFHKMYNNRRWRKASKAYLAQHPLCVYCLQIGRTSKAKLVDHIIPHKGDTGLFWDRSNWQPLCKHCHDSVKAREEARGYAVGCDPDGMPVDAGHHWNQGGGGANQNER